MDKIYVVYWSQTGNTQAMAEAIGKGIADVGKEARVVTVGEISVDDLKDANHYALGCPSMGVEVLEEDEMEPFVTRFDFILGEQALCTNACSVLSYKGKINISFLRTVKESEVEKEFFCFLRKFGLNIKVESNKR